MIRGGPRGTRPARSAESSSAETAESPAPARAAAMPAAVAPVTASAAACRRREADRVHHHVFFLRALHDVLERAVAVARVHRAVHAVGEDKHHAAALLVQ